MTKSSEVIDTRVSAWRRLVPTVTLMSCLRAACQDGFFFLVLNSVNSTFCRISTFYGIPKTLYPILSLQKLKKLLVEIQSGDRLSMRVCGGNIQISSSVAYKTGLNCIRLYQKSEI